MLGWKQLSPLADKEIFARPGTIDNRPVSRLSLSLALCIMSAYSYINQVGQGQGNIGALGAQPG
jgi:hypothetical protein